MRSTSWLLLSIAPISLGGVSGPALAGAVQRAGEILVEGRTLEPAQIFEDAPTETEILTREEIGRLPSTNAAEVIRKLPGIRTQRRVQGEEAAVSVEGLPANYTKILVNGERYTGEVGGVQDLRDLPIGDVERIEILRGAQGLRYGSEAAGAVINLVTRGAPEGYRGSAAGGGGDDGKVLGNLAVGLGGEAFGATFAFDHDQIDGFDPPPGSEGVVTGGNADSRRVSRDVYTSFRWAALPRLDVMTRLGWRREDEELAFDSRPGESDRRDTERWTLTQQATWRLGERGRVLGSLGWYDNTIESNVGREFTIADAEVKLDLSGEIFVETGPFSHALTLGLDARFDSLELEEGELAPQLTEIGVQPVLQGGSIEERLRKAGFFLIGESELAGWASLEWGARVQLHSRFDAKLAPQAALLLRPHEALRIRLSVGRNHFTPSLRDLFQPAVPNQGGDYFLEGNPDLAPETSTSWRAGLEWSPQRWISLSTVGFWNDIEDHIRSTGAGVVTVGFLETRITVPDEVRPGLPFICRETGAFFEVCRALETGEIQTGLVPDVAPLFRKTNLDTVRTRGFETRIELRPHPRFDLQLGYTWLDTRVLDSNLLDLDELPNEPHHTVDVLAGFTVPVVETELALQARWRSRALIESTGTGLLGFSTFEKADDSLFLDLRVSRRLTSWAEAHADFRNLTNQRVEDSNVVRGRTWFLGFRLSFGGSS